MTRVTDFHSVHEKCHDVLCDAYGNNVAFTCPDCGHPMLAIILPNQNRHGSTPRNPAACRHCRHRWWVSAEPDKKLLTIHACGYADRTLDASKLDQRWGSVLLRVCGFNWPEPA